MSSAVPVSRWVLQTHLPRVCTQCKGQAGQQGGFPEPGGENLQIRALILRSMCGQALLGPLGLPGDAVAAEAGRAGPGHCGCAVGWDGMRWDAMGCGGMGWIWKDPCWPGWTRRIPAAMQGPCAAAELWWHCPGPVPPSCAA